jgi:hypothetical protein
MWSIQQDHHSQGAIDVFEVEGAPVLIHGVGTYPTAISADGRSTQSEPHISISVYEYSVGHERFFNGVEVYAVGVWHRGRRRTKQVYSDVVYGLERRDTAPDKYIEMGKAQLTQALPTLRNLDALYAEADAVIAQVRRYTGPLSRAQYEAACAENGLDPLTDHTCQGYAVLYGDFGFPEYPATKVVAMRLARLRMQSIEAEQKNARAAEERTPPAETLKEGQLWEPCERCGAEPVYMPLNLCDKCWPSRR